MISNLQLNKSTIFFIQSDTTQAVVFSSCCLVDLWASVLRNMTFIATFNEFVGNLKHFIESL